MKPGQPALIVGMLPGRGYVAPPKNYTQNIIQKGGEIPPLQIRITLFLHSPL